jgi:hypothetical protein
VPRAARTIACCRRIPIAPNTISTGRMPALKRCGLIPRCSPPSASHRKDIATRTRRKWGLLSRGERMLASPYPLIYGRRRRESLRYQPFAAPDVCRFHTICCTKSSLPTDLRFRPVNLFDCARLQSFCGCQGRKGFVR